MKISPINNNSFNGLIKITRKIIPSQIISTKHLSSFSSDNSEDIFKYFSFKTKNAGDIFLKNDVLSEGDNASDIEKIINDKFNSDEILEIAHECSDVDPFDSEEEINFCVSNPKS